MLRTYEWYVKFTDDTEMYQYEDSGSENLWSTVLEIHKKNKISQVGWIPIVESKIQNLNELNENMNFVLLKNGATCIVDTKEEIPYIRRRNFISTNSGSRYCMYVLDIGGGMYAYIQNTGFIEYKSSKYWNGF